LWRVMVKGEGVYVVYSEGDVYVNVRVKAGESEGEGEGKRSE
jgi:hypothetical protein